MTVTAPVRRAGAARRPGDGIQDGVGSAVAVVVQFITLIGRLWELVTP